MKLKNINLHLRLILPLGLCLFILVSVALAYLYFHSSQQIANLSEKNIKHIQNLSNSNINRMTDLLGNNLNEQQAFSAMTVKQIEEIQINAAEDLLELTSRPFEKAFDTGDKRAVRTWLKRSGEAKGVEEVSVINEQGLVAFSSNKQLLGTRIPGNVMAQVATSDGKFRRWADNGLETFITKTIERKCIRCHVHSSWEGRVGENAGYFYLRVSTDAFDKLRKQNERTLAGQIAKNTAALSRQIEESKKMSSELKLENQAGQDVINSFNFRVFTVTVAGIIAISALLLYFLVRNIVSKPISRMIEALTESSDSLSLSCFKIQSLAEKASEQAASVENTAAFLEQISSATKQNARNADQVDVLMQESRGIIENANASMDELTGSMGEISKASEETSKIIKTIDEIAFQTNLLALNAAVEAARAGEAGAGFAVVADEVRNLALRAAEASNNTSELVQGTVGQVNAGLELVKKTNKAFSEVTISADKVNELISNITAANNDQENGIEKLNNAVTEVDKISQQNAADAKEGASASMVMNTEANQLKKFVGVLTTLVHGKGNGTGKKARKIKKRHRLDDSPKNHPEQFDDRSSALIASEADPYKSLLGTGNDLEEF